MPPTRRLDARASHAESAVLCNSAGARGSGRSSEELFGELVDVWPRINADQAVPGPLPLKGSRATDTTTPPPDLTGSVDERMRQLAQLAAEATLPAEWLKRQLDAALLAWANDETELDVDKELHTDY